MGLERFVSFCFTSRVAKANVLVMSNSNKTCMCNDTDASDTTEVLSKLSTPTSTSTWTRSRLRVLIDALAVIFKAILPRRRHETTGPLVLIFDMLLSIFVPRGACKSVINKLPVHIVGSSKANSISAMSSKTDTIHSANCSDTLMQKDSCDHISLAIPLSTSDKCAICLGTYEIGEAVRQLRCDHIFHSEVRH